MPQIYQSNKQRKETDWSGAAENAMAVTTRAVEQSKRNAMAANKLASLLRQDPKRYAGVKATIGEDGELTGNDKLANSMVARLVRHQRDSDNFKNTKLYDENQYKADLKTNDDLNKQIVNSKLDMIGYGKERLDGLRTGGIPDPKHVNADFFSKGMGNPQGNPATNTAIVLPKDIADAQGLDIYGKPLVDANGKPQSSATQAEIDALMGTYGQAEQKDGLAPGTTYRKDSKSERESKGGGYSYTYENNLNIDGQLKPDTIQEEQIKEGFDRTTYEEDYAMFMRGIDDVISMAGTGNAAQTSTWDDQIKKAQEVEKEISAILGKDAYGSSFVAGERPTIKGSVKFSEDTKNNSTIINNHLSATGAVDGGGGNKPETSNGSYTGIKGDPIDIKWSQDNKSTTIVPGIAIDKGRIKTSDGKYNKDDKTFWGEMGADFNEMLPSANYKRVREGTVDKIYAFGKLQATVAYNNTVTALQGADKAVIDILTGFTRGTIKDSAANREVGRKEGN